MLGESVAVTRSEFPSPPVRVRGDDPGSLIAAVPAILGFYPTRSVILLFLGGASGSRVGPVIRHDSLPLGITADAARRVVVNLCERIKPLWETQQIRAVICLFVEDWPSAIHGVFAGELGDRLAEQGITLASALWTPAIGPGQPWRVVGDPGRRGKLPDPRASETSATVVMDGRQIFESRDDIARTIEPASTDESEFVAAHLRACYPAQSESEGFGEILQAAALVDSGEQPELQTLAMISRSFDHKDRVVRDAALALAGTTFANAAEQLWTLLARLLPPSRRADPLTLLGHSAYLRGDGALACVAFTAALDDDPSHILAGLLDEALQSAVSPDLVREMTEKASGIAAGLGFDLRQAG